MKRHSQDIKIGILTHLSRSGSTLLARMLDDYDDICVTTEGEFPLELFGVKSYAPILFQDHNQIQAYLDTVLKQTRVASWKLSDATILESCQSMGYPISGPALVQSILAVYRNMYKPKAKIVIYKACPFMPWHISESMQHFPEVKFLHLLRDPRAVYHSQKNSIDPFTQKPYSNSALKTALDWKKATDLALVDAATMEMRFENLVDDPTPIIKSILQFLALENEAKSHNEIPFMGRMEQVDQELHQEINLAPDPKKNLAWQTSLSARELKVIDSLLHKRMIDNGYTPSVSSPSSFFQVYLFMGILRESFITLLRRSRRFSKQMLSNPQHLTRKIKLKMRHG